MKKLIWRLRYTVYGQYRCPIGWRNWWAFSAAYEEADSDWDYSDSPIEAARDEMQYMAADAR